MGGAAAAALGIAASMALASAVHAQQSDDATPACPAQSWGALDWPGASPEPATNGSTVTGDTVTLVRVSPTGGTSAEVGDWGVNASTISVDYALDADAATTAGAVRLFVYLSPGADTATQAPDAVAIADGPSGTLTITLAEAARIGTAGLTYDASNASTGSVVFTNLVVDGEPAAFVRGAACDQADEDPGEDPGDEQPGDEQPGDGDGDEKPAPGAGGGQELPKTGVPALALGAAGLAALVVGGGLMLVRRRAPVG